MAEPLNRLIDQLAGKLPHKEEDPKNTGCICPRSVWTRYPHSCPFASDIRGDDSKRCRCCEYHQRQCAMDI